MAKQQYRVYGAFKWMSSSGNAILAIYNPPSSGKRLTINQFELQNMTGLNPTALGGAASPATVCSIFYTSNVNHGVVATPAPNDTNYPWPNDIVVTTCSVASTTPTQILRRVAISKQMHLVNTAWVSMNSNIGLGYNSIFTRQKGKTPTGNTPIEINPGESLGFGVTTLTSAIPLKFYASLRVDGHCYAVSENCAIKSSGEMMFAIENPGGSGKVVELLEFSVEEMGNYDSPYFQIVPVGQLNATGTADPSRVVTPMKMDTNYPSAPFYVYQDIPILPQGVPQVYLSEASTGSPKGFNYLQTKDFIGPVFRTIFGENEGTTTHGAPGTGTMDSLGHYSSQKLSDVFARHANIILNEGEGIALVSGAETAVLTSSAVAISGWATWNIGVTISAESKYSPTVTFAGLQPGTEVRIYDTLGSELAGTESSGTSFQYSYSYDADTTSTVVMHSLGYLPIRLENFVLGRESQTVPVQQQVDRQYQNI